MFTLHTFANLSAIKLGSCAIFFSWIIARATTES